MRLRMILGVCCMVASSDVEPRASRSTVSTLQMSEEYQERYEGEEVLKERYRDFCSVYMLCSRLRLSMFYKVSGVSALLMWMHVANFRPRSIFLAVALPSHTTSCPKSWFSLELVALGLSVQRKGWRLGLFSNHAGTKAAHPHESKIGRKSK